MGICFLKKRDMSGKGVLSDEDYNACLSLCNKILTNDVIKTEHIYGVKRNVTLLSPKWTRTDDAVGMVAQAMKTTSDTPVNDFDTCYPWSAIESYNYNLETNQVVANFGDENFTFDTTATPSIIVLTKIPEFWYKRYVEDGYEYIQIADYAAPGFAKSEEFSIGRYVTGLVIEENVDEYSTTISSQTTPVTKSNSAGTFTHFRELNTTVFDGKLQVMDITAYNTIQLLYLVEYADFNSQEKLGRGFVDAVYTGNTPITSGWADDLGMKSGSLNNDGWSTMIYRGIENVFGNVCQVLDGILLNNRVAYICTDPDKFSEDYTSEGYIEYGETTPYGEYCTRMTYDENYPLIMLPTRDADIQGSQSTGTCDIVWSSTDGVTVNAGGGYRDRDDAGLFNMCSDTNFSSSNAWTGVRHMRRRGE